MNIIDGAIVTVPEQVPATEIVKVCAVGLFHVSALNASAVVDGFCNVQAGCVVSATDITWETPTGCFVTLS